MSISIILSIYGRKGAPIINEEVEIPKHYRIIDLLHRLEIEDRLPQKFGSGDGFSEFLIFVNGINAMVGSGLEMIFQDCDRVVVLPALAGG